LALQLCDGGESAVGLACEAFAVDASKDSGAELGEAVDDGVDAERGCLFSVEGDRSHAVDGLRITQNA
jgi:hypothetical protein